MNFRNMGWEGGVVPQKFFYYHPDSGEIGQAEDVSELSRAEAFAVHYQLLNKAQPGWIVVDSTDEAEMARVQAQI